MPSVRGNRFMRRPQTVSPADQRSAMAGTQPVDSQTGFLCHPRGFPLLARRKWFARSSASPGNEYIGLIFDSGEYHPPGAFLELTIPVRERVETFTGRVILVRKQEDRFEIGLWLDQGDDASRARIVEQICHIEIYLKIKKYRDGPYNLDPERVASEWITRYASGVPVLQSPRLP